MFTAAVIHADHIRHSNAENNIRRKNRKRSSEATRSWAEGLSEELKWCVHLHFNFNTGQYQSASVKTNHLCVDTRFRSASLTRVRAENSFTRLHTPTLFVSMNVCVCVLDSLFISSSWWCSILVAAVRLESGGRVRNRWVSIPEQVDPKHRCLPVCFCLSLVMTPSCAHPDIISVSYRTVMGQWDRKTWL